MENSMEIHGIPWNFPWIFFNGIPWKNIMKKIPSNVSEKFHGIPWKIPWNSIEFPWKFPWKIQ
jgi:hypothetical protein